MFDKAHLVVTVLALAAAATSLGLTYHGVETFGTSCLLFIKLTPDSDYMDFEGKQPTCSLSLAAGIIATTCLAAAVVIELVKTIYQVFKNNFGKIVEGLLLFVACVFLCISMITISAGWGKTCNVLKGIDPQDSDMAGMLSCTKHAYINNGGEVIAAAICAGIGLIISIGSLVFFGILVFTNKDEYTDLDINTKGGRH